MYSTVSAQYYKEESIQYTSKAQYYKICKMICSETYLTTKLIIDWSYSSLHHTHWYTVLLIFLGSIQVLAGRPFWPENVRFHIKNNIYIIKIDQHIEITVFEVEKNGDPSSPTAGPSSPTAGQDSPHLAHLASSPLLTRHTPDLKRSWNRKLHFALVIKLWG